MHIRPEQKADVAALRALISAAFATARHASGTEAQIVDALRTTGQLHLSLVAQAEGAVVGHVAFSRSESRDAPLAGSALVLWRFCQRIRAAGSAAP